MKIMVSACLLGDNCKYDGGNNRNEALLEMLAGHEVIPVCPEVAGGLPVPRVPAELVNGRAVSRNGEDVDAAFRKGTRGGVYGKLAGEEIQSGAAVNSLAVRANGRRGFFCADGFHGRGLLESFHHLILVHRKDVAKNTVGDSLAFSVRILDFSHAEQEIVLYREAVVKDNPGHAGANRGSQVGQEIADGMTEFVECGPGQVLTGLIGRIQKSLA